MPLLIGSLLGIGILIPGAYFWHGYQVSRLSGVFLERADHLQEEGDGLGEAEYLQRFLRLHPEDFQITVRLARTLERMSADAEAKSRASNVYLRAVSLLPEEKQLSAVASDLRLRVAALSLDTQKYQLAQEQSAVVLKHDPRQAEALRVRALARHAQFATSKELVSATEVRQALETAIAAQPDDLELATKLAYFYRDQLSESELAEEADQLMNHVVAQNATIADGYLARYRYRMRYDSSSDSEADSDLARALELEPESLAVLSAAAERAQDQGRLLEAETYHEQMIQAAPQLVEGYLGLARLRASRGGYEAAIELLQDSRSLVVENGVAVELALAELYLGTRRFDEVEHTLQFAEKVYDQRRHQFPRANRIALENKFALLRAQWEIGRGQPSLAIPHLKRVAATQATGQEARQDTRGRSQALGLLGMAYSELQQWDQAALGYEQAALLQPHLPELLVSAAVCWANAGQPEAAIRCYRQALTLGDRPEFWSGLAEVLFQREVAQASADRNWKAFEEALTRASQNAEPSASLSLLQANYELVRYAPGEVTPEARERAAVLLQAAESEPSPPPELLQKLTLIYERLGRTADAQRVSNRLQEAAGDEVEAAIFDAERCMVRGDHESAQRVLNAAMDSAGMSRRDVLRHALSDVLASEGRTEEARHELLKIIADHPENRMALAGLLELCLRTGEFQDAQRWEESLRRVDQNHAAEWRFYRAVRLILQSPVSRKADLDEAEKLQRLVESERPAWPSAHLLKALIYERRQKVDQAVVSYQAAIRMGERRVIAYQRLVALLHQTQRFAEAQSVLAQLKHYVPSSQSLSTLAVYGSLQLNQLDEAIRWAESRAEQQPNDPLAWLWLGNLYFASGDSDKAETVLLRAVDAAPDDRRARSALFSYYAQVGNGAAATEELHKLLDLEHWTAPQRALIAAQGHALLQQERRAEDFYEEALEQAPGDVNTHLLAAQFYLAHDPSRAEKILRDTLRINPESATARRMLGGLLIAGGGQEAFQEALELLKKSPPQSEDWIFDQRLRAVAFAQRGALAEAQRVLEEMAQSGAEPTTDDRLLLARLYELEGKISAAREQHLSLAHSADVKPLHLAVLIQFLIRHHQSGEAAPWLDELDRRAPDTWLAVSCRSRLWSSEERNADARELLDGYLERNLSVADSDARKAQLLTLVGDLYSELTLHAEAEAVYRRMLAHAPARYDLLAGSLARQGRLGEAVELFLKEAESDLSVRPAMLLAPLLAAEKASLDDYPAARSLLQRAQAANPEDLQVLFAAAQAHLVSGEIEQAIQLYEQVLRLNARHVPTLNNLAVLMAEAGEKEQAIAYADRALDIAGSLQPNLLDTKATILLQQGRYAAATQLLKQAVALADPDPRHLLHLAYAHHQLGAAGEARQVFAQAQQRDLDGTLLASTDRNWLRVLQQDLKH